MHVGGEGISGSEATQQSRGWRVAAACTGRCQREEAGWRTCSQAGRRVVGQVSGGHLAAPPGTVCCQAVSQSQPKISLSTPGGACVREVFTHHSLWDDVPAQLPGGVPWWCRGLRKSQPWRSSATSQQAFAQLLTSHPHLTCLGHCLGARRGRPLFMGRGPCEKKHS